MIDNYQLIGFNQLVYLLIPQKIKRKRQNCIISTIRIVLLMWAKETRKPVKFFDTNISHLLLFLLKYLKLSAGIYEIKKKLFLFLEKKNKYFLVHELGGTHIPSCGCDLSSCSILKNKKNQIKILPSHHYIRKFNFFSQIFHI